MNDSDSDRRHAVALFRYGLIAHLVRLKPGSKGGFLAQTAEYAPQRIFGDMLSPGICGVIRQRAEADGHFG